MKWRKGKRPWTVRLFAIAFLLVALIGLFLAITEPFLNFFVWSKRVPDIAWSQDGALIASFSMFTMALIPIIWIYGLGTERARWVVLVFGSAKIALWVYGYLTVTYAPALQALRFLEPTLIVAAFWLLFNPYTIGWLKHDRASNTEPLSGN